MGSNNSQDSEEKKLWRCVGCGHLFEPDPPNFNCPNCGNKITVSTYDLRQQPRAAPRPRGPHKKVCQFQIASEKTRKRKEYFKCGLTGFASSQTFAGMDYRRLVHYDSCDLKLCPLYQTWSILRSTDSTHK